MDKLGRGWEGAKIYPIYKASDEESTAKYRGIALLDANSKHNGSKTKSIDKKRGVKEKPSKIQGGKSCKRSYFCAK